MEQARPDRRGEPVAAVLFLRTGTRLASVGGAGERKGNRMRRIIALNMDTARFGRWRLLAAVLVPLTLGVAGCISSSNPPPPATIVIPQGAAVVCPNGSHATFYDNAYHC